MNSKSKLKAFKLFADRLSNLRKIGKKTEINIYNFYKKNKHNKHNVLFAFGIELMERIGVNQIKEKDFSTITDKKGVVYLCLFKVPIINIYKEYFENDYLLLVENLGLDK